MPLRALAPLVAMLIIFLALLFPVLAAGEGAETPGAESAEAAAGHGGGEAGGHEGTPQGVMNLEIPLMIWTWITFGLLLVLLRVFAWKPLVATLKQREDTIRLAIEQAETGKKEAQKLLDDHRQKMIALEKEVANTLDQGKRDAEAWGQKITDEAREESRRLKDKAERDIARARDDAMLEVRDQMLTLSTVMASKILERNLKPEDQAPYVREVLAEIGKKR